MMGEFQIEKKNIIIMKKYILKERELISEMVKEERRGVQVDIVVKGVKNMKMVEREMREKFDKILREG